MRFLDTTHTGRKKVAYKSSVSMATESPIRMSETGGKWPSHQEAATFAAEELGLLLKGHKFHGRGRDVVPNRSGSAPPSMEGSFLSMDNILSQQAINSNASLASLNSAMQNYESEEQLRADPAYLSYYLSNINLNPRLPPPLISSENRRVVRHIGSFGNNWPLTSVDDSSNGSLHRSRGTLSTQYEESEDDQSPQKPPDDWVDETGGFWSGQEVASSSFQHRHVVDSVQEDSPHIQSSEYSHSNLLSHGVAEEAFDHDADSRSLCDPIISTSNGVTSTFGADDRRTLSSSDPLGGPVSSSSSHDLTGNRDVNDLGVTTIESDLKALNISNLPTSENQKNQEHWQRSSQNNLLLHQVQQQSNLSQFQTAKSQVISQGANCTYVGVDRFVHNTSKFTAEVQPVLQSSGFTPPFATAAAYMTSANPLYPNLQAPGLYSQQYVGGYALNPSIVPPYIAGYPPHGSVPVVVDGTAGPSYTAQTSGVSTHGADMQHLNKFYGQLGFPLQPSFGDPVYMQYHHPPYGDVYGISGQFDPLVSRGGVDIGGQARALDSQKGPNVAVYLDDHKFHQTNGGLNNMNPRRGGPMSSNYYGSPPNMGFLMQYPNSPLASPVLPGSPVGGTGVPGGRNEMRFALSSGRNAGLYPGWQGPRGFESFDDSKIYNFLEELKSGKGRRFELSDIVGHIVEFSADQHGSRFIQQKLENCSVEEKVSVFKEVLPQASKLMTDVFGNYVIQKFFEYGSPGQRKELAYQLTGQVLPLSLQMYGCRVIQKALDVIDLEQKAHLVRELDGHVMRCVRDQNGNHVIQKCIESIPTGKIEFIISAFCGQVMTLSMHPYGCRVIQRVLEHCTDELQCQFIVDEILESVCTLAQDQYGNYVTQHVLERGKPHERSQIISKLSGHVVQLSQHKFASNVVEKCLEYGGSAERELLIGEIFGHNEGTDNLLTMMKDQFANYVVQKILEICSDNQRAMLLGRVRVHAHALKKYTYGKHIVARSEQLFGEENPTTGS